MFQVLEILPGRVTVASDGLFRVVLNPGNEIVRELLDLDRAADVVDTFNGCNRDQKAEAVSYDALAQRSSS